MTLFFFPHAGGSAKSYASFKRFLPKDLNVITMELSGRFTRSDGPMLHDIESCISELFDSNEKLSELLKKGDYAVFGHSMGTVLATEFVRQIREKGYPAPVHMFLSGKNAPDENLHCFGDIDKVTDMEITEFFDHNSMTFSQVIPDAELVAQINRILCNDVRMAEKYITTPRQVQFGCDVTAIYGTDDTMLKNADMNGWGRYTDKSCEVVAFSGGHFYYTQHKEEVCKLICNKLRLN
ncbi:MAG: thioesterase [Ruminococcus albus]|jgi:surfactin synthase thioesterase subunit|nr:thioesterase [Ruminococcus albus]